MKILPFGTSNYQEHSHRTSYGREDLFHLLELISNVILAKEDQPEEHRT